MNTHRIFWEYSSPQNTEKVVSTTQNKYFGQITVTKSDFIDNYTCFTDDLQKSIFNNVPLQNRIIKELSAQIRFFFKKYKIKPSDLVLVAGIGNESITVDSLGCKVCDGLIVTSHRYLPSDENVGNLAFVKCGVSGLTGIDSFVHLSAVIEKTKPAIVLVVDTLAANTAKRLSSSIQISDKGICPGQGVGNAKQNFSDNTLLVPIVAIGVPLVIYAQKIIADYYQVANVPLPDKSLSFLSKLIVTGNDIDFLIKDFSRIIAEGINNAVHSVGMSY